MCRQDSSNIPSQSAAAPSCTTEQVAQAQPHRQAPKETMHLGGFDALRLLFCSAVVAHHVTFYTAAIHADIEGLADWSGNSFLAFTNGAGFPAVDGFFMISGFFTTLTLLKKRTNFQVKSWIQSVLLRCLRFWPLHLVVVLLALSRGDPLYWSASRPAWDRIVTTFLGKNYYDNVRGWFDLTSTPLWSNCADMHITAVLLLIVPLTRTLNLNPKKTLFAALIVGIAIRAAVFATNSGCMRLSCLDHPTTTFLGAGDPLVSTFVQDFGMPALEVKPAACQTCPLTNEAWIQTYAPLYANSHARAAPFFVGALMATYFSDLSSKQHRSQSIALETSTQGLMPKSNWNSQSLLFQLFFIAAITWVSERHGLFGLLGFSPVLTSSLPEAALEVVGGTFDAVAWASIALPTMVPRNHLFRFEMWSAVLAHPLLRAPARLTFCIYCLHWPVMIEVLRILPKEWLLQVVERTNSGLSSNRNSILSNGSFGHSFAILLLYVVVMTLTVLAASLAHRLVEEPCLKLTKRWMMRQADKQA